MALKHLVIVMAVTLMLERVGSVRTGCLRPQCLLFEGTVMTLPMLMVSSSVLNLWQFFFGLFGSDFISHLSFDYLLLLKIFNV